MRLKHLLFFAIISAAATALLALGAQDADAARLGGGKSFGGAPFMGKSVSPPPAPAPGLNRPAAPGRDLAGAGAAAPVRPGFGGMLGGLLAGSLIGSLLFGGGFHGGGFMDILLIGLLFYLACKIFARVRNPVPAGGPNPQTFHEREKAPSSQRSGMDWEQFRDGPAAPGAAAASGDAVPPDFDAEEFLRGAKLAYARLQASWDARDLEDIARFATGAVLEEIQAQAESDPNPSTTEILLINAQLLSVTDEGRGRQRASVYFDVLLREDQQAEATSQAREVWHFLREAEESWKLDGIQQVEG